MNYEYCFSVIHMIRHPLNICLGVFESQDLTFSKEILLRGPEIEPLFFSPAPSPVTIRTEISGLP